MRVSKLGKTKSTSSRLFLSLSAPAAVVVVVVVNGAGKDDDDGADVSARSCEVVARAAGADAADVKADADDRSHVPRMTMILL